MSNSREREKKLRTVLCRLTETFLLFLAAFPVWGQQSAHYDISPFGVVGLPKGEMLGLTANARSQGAGCIAQLGFEGAAGISITRSLNVNLAPGRSASLNYMPTKTSDTRMLVRPVAWVDRGTGQADCDLSLELSDQYGKVLREISHDLSCSGKDCSGVPITELGQSKLRLYLASTNDHMCHAQMGFRLSSGKTSATSKYVALTPNRADWVDWRLGSDDFSPSESVIPVVAFHKGDSCVASSEIVSSEDQAAAKTVTVDIFESPVIGLAMDPISLPKTIHTLQTELRTNPNDLWAINALGQAYDSQGERLMAINLLKDAVAVNPKASESWLLLAKFHYERQDFLSAIQALEKCLSLDPNNLAAQAAYADSLAKAHRIDEAGELFTKLLADKKTSTPFVLTSYADFLYTQERYSDALEYVTESDAQHPNCGRTLYTTARILLKLNRVPEATQEAERAVKMDSGFRLARILLVRLYELQGETQEATEQKAWLRTDSDKNH